ncbi:hypothetical protein HU200_054727 [Digitaria exilis]|uniref:KIB1-4 beta-propeller domain-containing protein n=1 Tax=Digitaria exilis TaxID=1010633 RepID=A0A835APS5_9POAL|nr:hypothetical protein HU200_054727 [Digitaria exilis]
MIADRLLSSDISDYVCFRAACSGWRACCVDPRAQAVGDRRFHPRRWVMLSHAYDISRNRRCFVNVSIGRCVYLRIPDLRSYNLLGTTVEGLLLLYRRGGAEFVQLLNPLTGQLTDLPGVDTIRAAWGMPNKARSKRWSFTLLSAGIADDSTVALLCNFNVFNVLAVAKPGDEQWTRLSIGYTFNNFMPMVLPYAGRLYCVAYNRILVVEAAAEQQRPGLKAVPLVHYELKAVPLVHYELDTGRSEMMYPAYDDEGNLILVQRSKRGFGYSSEMYTTYQAKLDKGSVVRMRGLGGKALFLFGDRSQSVPPRVSSPPINADTVYVCNDSGNKRPEVVAFDLRAAESNFDEYSIASPFMESNLVVMKIVVYVTYIFK